MNCYALFHGWLVTANDDGSIPLNAKAVCQVAEVDEGLMRMLLAQANDHARQNIGKAAA